MPDYCPMCNADSDDIDSFINGDCVCNACGHCWNQDDDDDSEE